MASMKAPMKILVTVVGTTGVGKSKLAIEIAKKLKGACINGDSMQVYKGLDIITNKPDAMERSQCPHYLFDFIEPSAEYSVSSFTNDAIECIDAIHNKDSRKDHVRQKALHHLEKGQEGNEAAAAGVLLPVLVGGTNYYIQSLLLKNSTITTADTPGLSNKLSVKESAHASLPLELSTELCHILTETDPRLKSSDKIITFCSTNNLHKTLMGIDPLMAKKWHPKDYRKIRRSLEIYYTTGMNQSDWYFKQKTLSFEKQDTPLRYPTIMIWLYGQPEQLDVRLDKRVDAMMSKGMLGEMLELRQKMLKNEVIGLESAYTRGILQAIGFKEFQEYFEELDRKKNQAQEEDELKSEGEGEGNGKKKVKEEVSSSLFRTGLVKMKTATRQYARQQIHWLKTKLAPIILAEHELERSAIYLIDASDPAKVTPRIINSAVRLVKNFSAGFPNESPTTLDSDHLSFLLDTPETETNWEHFHCSACIEEETGEPRVFVGERVWKVHERSRAHQRNLRYKDAPPRPSPGDKEGWLEYRKKQKHDNSS